MADGQSQQALQSVPTTVPSWWSVLEQHSRLLVAAIDISNHRIEWTSDRFRRLVGMIDAPPTLGDTVLKRLTPDDQLWVRERIRRHILHAILTERYQRSDLLPSRWLHESLIVAVSPLQDDRARFVEFTVSSDHLQLRSLEPAVGAALDRCWSETPSPNEVLPQLNDPHSPLQAVLQLLNPQTYRASGIVLIEGMDVSDREVTQRLMHLLLDRE
ncbi:MAG: GAF domain-containing protein, partial [Cyanobacteria bacterium P01_C01_bin.147]